MARTTAALVAGIVEVELPDGAVLEDFLAPFILPANLLVTDVCGAAGYSDEKLEMIERWLGAHFYQILAPGANTERAGRVAQTVRSKVDLGLNVTHYGQQAMVLDTAGGLAEINQALEPGGGLPSGVFGAWWLGIEDS